MSTLLQDLGIQELNRLELLDLAQEIIEIANNKPMPPISDEVRAMIRERLQDIKDNPDDHVPWEEVYAAAKARFSK